MKPITNTQNIIDSRDIIERIEELEELEDLEKEYNSFSEQDELKSLRAMVEQAEGCGDFDLGEALIHESYFTGYCKELCTDEEYLPADLPGFIENNIDWDGVAGELMTDYTEIDFDGTTYFMRT